LTKIFTECLNKYKLISTRYKGLKIRYLKELYRNGVVGVFDGVSIKYSVRKEIAKILKDLREEEYKLIEKILP
jgi:hypothetical protein